MSTKDNLIKAGNGVLGKKRAESTYINATGNLQAKNCLST